MVSNAGENVVEMNLTHQMEIYVDIHIVAFGIDKLCGAYGEIACTCGQDSVSLSEEQLQLDIFKSHLQNNVQTTGFVEPAAEGLNPPTTC